MVKHMKITGFDKLNTKLGRLVDDLPIVAINAMRQQGIDIKKKSDANIKSVDLVNFGNLLNSGYISQPVKTTFGWQVEVGYGAEHAVYQHEGWDNQSMPPLEPIEQWVNTKLGIPAPESTWIAYAIAINLESNGHDAEPFLQEAVDSVKKGIPRDVSRLIKNWLKRRYGKTGGIK